MSEERDSVYILHMLECIERIEGYVCGDKQRFLEELVLQGAVVRVLQVMAESSQRLSETVKDIASNIDWRGISGFRNVLVHDYLGGIDV